MPTPPWSLSSLMHERPRPDRGPQHARLRPSRGARLCGRPRGADRGRRAAGARLSSGAAGRDGREIVLETTSVTLDADGGTSILSLLRDVTEERRVEAARAQAEAAVRAALAEERHPSSRDSSPRQKIISRSSPSLVNLQANKLEDGAARVALDEDPRQGCALIAPPPREALPGPKTLARIDMREYVVGLCLGPHAHARVGPRGAWPSRPASTRHAPRPRDPPCPAASSLNELLTNALKRRVPRPGRRRAARRNSGSRADDGHLRVVGRRQRGGPRGTGRASRIRASLGWILVRTLGDQMGASTSGSRDRGASDAR